MKALKVFLLSFILVLAFGSVWAEKDPSVNQVSEIDSEVEEMIALDEDVQPEDLGISEPRILPDHPFYFLKNWTRGLRTFLTFDPVRKAELRQRFANEKLIELKKMIAQKKKAEEIERATENYQREIERIKTITERIKEKAKENPRIESFLDKYVKHQLLHQRLLERLENQVSPRAFEKIKTARERHLKRFGEVMSRLEDRPEKIREKIERKIKEIRGSEFKSFKNLEILKRLEKVVPEKARPALRQAQENFLRKFKTKLEQIPPERLEKFQAYAERISGEKQMEILETLRIELKTRPVIRKKIMEIRERVIEKTKERAREINCPEIKRPTSGFCEEGRIVVRKDERGCIISFDCLIPAEVRLQLPQKEEEGKACITLWNPVCGKDGRTYSNACFAKLAGVEIAYKGRCRALECQTDADCPQPRCGPAGTLRARCLGVQAKCIKGKCQTVSTVSPLKSLPAAEPNSDQ